MSDKKPTPDELDKLICAAFDDAMSRYFGDERSEQEWAAYCRAFKESFPVGAETHLGRVLAIEEVDGTLHLTTVMQLPVSVPEIEISLVIPE